MSQLLMVRSVVRATSLGVRAFATGHEPADVDKNYRFVNPAGPVKLRDFDPAQLTPIGGEKDHIGDPGEVWTGNEKAQFLARMAGDDRFEKKVYFRDESRANSRENPTLIPARFTDRNILCQCTPDMDYQEEMWIRKGIPKRCRCGIWFKLIDADGMPFT